MFEPLFNQVGGLQICKKRRFQRRCFSVNIAKFSKKLILKKICERLLLLWLCSEYFKAKLFIHEDCKIGVKCFSTFAGKHLYRSVFFNKYSCRMQLKPIFIQKEVPALVFSWQLSEIFNNNFFKERKKALLWEKKHCYKKSGSDIYRKSNYTTFFVTSPRFLYFSGS